MSSAPDPQLQRALTALRALEPPSNGFEARLRGSLLQAAADPALFPRRGPAPARPAPVQLSFARRWRQRPLAALSLAALSLAGIAAAVTSRGWLWQQSGPGAPALSAEPPSPAASRAASSEQAPAPEVPALVELPPVSEPTPQPMAVPPQAERVTIPERVRAHREAPVRDPGFAPVSPLAAPERAPAPGGMPRFDLPDLPAHGAEQGSAPRGERSERREDRVPSPDDRSRALDRSSEARDRAAERRRQLDRPRPILEPPPALERERRAPSDLREREHEQPEPHESEGGRGRR